MLVAAQVFIEEEVLADVVIVSLLLTAVLAASHPRAALLLLRPAAAGLAAGAAVALAICGYGLWIQFHGPLTEHGSPFPNSKTVNSAGAFVNPSAGLVFHTASSAAYAVGHGLIGSEYLAYLGWPLLVLLALIVIRYWGDLRVRAAGVSWAVLELLSLGGGSAVLPFHWLQGLPLLVEMLPDRLSILADGAAAAVLAFGLDLARARASQTAASQTAASQTGVQTRHRRLGPAGYLRRPRHGGGAGAAAAIPRPAAAAPARPSRSGGTPCSPGCGCPPTASVLVVPAPYSHQSSATRWQAVTGQPGEQLVAGLVHWPRPGGRATTGAMDCRPPNKRVICLDALWKGSLPASRCSMVPAALAYWAARRHRRRDQPRLAARAVPDETARPARHQGRPAPRLAGPNPAGRAGRAARAARPFCTRGPTRWPTRWPTGASRGSCRVGACD